MDLLVNALILWLGASAVIMFGLTSWVFLTGRKPAGRGARVYEFNSDREKKERVAHLHELEAQVAVEVAAAADHPPEPAVTHLVTSDSAVIDRLLAGAVMPCGLEHLPSSEADPNRMAFATAGYDPRVVAVSVVDELERLGLDIEPLDFSEARAWRDGFELAITIYLEPRRVIRDRRPAFPDAPPGAVVIEFSVV
ncbi:MAG: hypothetical protein S0880_08095 [Actinomycetota bacterium]|nr:hypothetical protein [Actinomycetota bacterium]